MKQLFVILLCIGGFASAFAQGGDGTTLPAANVTPCDCCKAPNANGICVSVTAISISPASACIGDGRPVTFVAVTTPPGAAVNWDILVTGGPHTIGLCAKKYTFTPTANSSSTVTITAKCGGVTSAPVIVEVVAGAPFLAAGATIAPGAAPSHPLDECENGLTRTENVEIGITAYKCQGNWHAILNSLKGNYSLQAQLQTRPPGQQEVTGPPPGNTTQANFCAQVTRLKALGKFNNECPGPWYMLAAVQAHEHVHESRLKPALEQAAPAIELLVNALTVPDTGQSQADAIAQIIASPAFVTARGLARTEWSAKYVTLIEHDDDRGDPTPGPTEIAEHGVVDPMIKAICDYAAAHVWGACPSCP